MLPNVETAFAPGKRSIGSFESFRTVVAEINGIGEDPRGRLQPGLDTVDARAVDRHIQRFSFCGCEDLAIPEQGQLSNDGAAHQEMAGFLLDGLVAHQQVFPQHFPPEKETG